MMTPTQVMAQPQFADETIADGLMPVDPVEPAESGMSTGAKVGIAAGVTGATGLAAFGLYKLGAHMGWWGGGPGVVFDDDAPGDGGGGGGGGGGGNTPNPQQKKRGRAVGKPPNVTGDPKGYNTTLWPAPGPVRLAMISQSYKVTMNHEPLTAEGETHPQVRRLQEDWNKVIKGIDSGRVKLPSNVDHPNWLKHYRGLLVADGVPGKNTLNALEVLFSNYTQNGLFWTTLVAQVKS